PYQHHPPTQLSAHLNPLHLASEPPATSCRSPAPPQDAPKTTADAAQKTTALPQDAQPHATALALLPPRSADTPTPLPSAPQTGSGSTAQHQGSSGCG